MAKFLLAGANQTQILSTTLASVLLFSSAVAAAELRDPTRPGWSPPTDDAVANKPAPRLLTAIVIGPQRRLALIGNNYLAVGDMLGDARLIRIDFDQVVLQGRDGQRILRLIPALETRAPAAKVKGS